MSKDTVSQTPPRVNGYSPWGTILDVEHIADGLDFVMTSSHGGLFVSPHRNAQIPDYMRDDGRWPDKLKGWYEEDSNWAIPYLVFAEELSTNDNAKNDIATGIHRQAMQDFSPAMLDRWTAEGGLAWRTSDASATEGGAS